ncbi:MAG: ADP-ribosylglycohydrolase family protein [Bacteroidia bacterium]
MRAYGTYNQPAGTWSDDTSLACCTAESLLNGFNLASMASRFVSWRNYAHTGPHTMKSSILALRPASRSTGWSPCSQAKKPTSLTSFI